jgi:hypothetical protein
VNHIRGSVLFPRTAPLALRARENGPARYTGTVDSVALSEERGSTMNVLHAIPTMLVIWAVVTVSFLILLAYRGQITRYEEDQLFLNGGNAYEEQQQHEILRKVNRIAPFVRILGGATSLITASIVGLWVFDAWQRFK